MLTQKDKKVMKNSKKFAAFMTDLYAAMEKHEVEDLLVIFGMDKHIRNTYLTTNDNGDHPLYTNLSDGINAYLGGKQKF